MKKYGAAQKKRYNGLITLMYILAGLAITNVIFTIVLILKSIYNG